MCSPWQGFAYRPGADKPVLCCICMEWKSFAELFHDEKGSSWDICLDCAEHERQTLESECEEEE